MATLNLTITLPDADLQALEAKAKAQVTVPRAALAATVRGMLASAGR